MAKASRYAGPAAASSVLLQFRVTHIFPYPSPPKFALSFSFFAAIAVDIARNVTMLGPIIAQRHQQLLAKFGSVGTVWRKLFESPKAQCLLGCLSQFGFGGTGSFDYAQLDNQEEEKGDGAETGSCEPQSGSSSSGGSSGSTNGGTRGISPSPNSIAQAAAAVGFSLPAGFDLSAMTPSDMKAAAASFGISLPNDFNISALASFGKAGAAVSFPSASLPRPSPSAAAQAPQFNPASMAAMCGLVPPNAGVFSSSLAACVVSFGCLLLRAEIEAR
jgi:hypothetical protein